MINEATKIQEPENEPISQLLGSLKRVEAPNDFDFCVRARIANGRPKATSWTPVAVRYAVPLVLLMLIGSYLGLTSFYSTDGLDVPVVVEVSSPDIAPPIKQQSDVEVVTPTDKIAAGVRIAGPDETESNNGNVEPNLPKKSPIPGPKVERPGGGSYVMAANKSRIILPIGVEPTLKSPVTNKTGKLDSLIPAREILKSIGVSATFAGSGWKVNAVASGTAAGRSGIIAGDVIETINGQPVSEKTSFGSNFTGKSVQVRRDGKSILIGLK